MGHVDVGHWWDRVAMDLLDMSVTTAKGNWYILEMVDCFSRWTKTYLLPDKTASTVANAFFQQIVCRFKMPIVIHSDQGREFENKIMQELCIMGGSHKTKTTPYHPESDGMVERFNRTLLMMLAMFAGENRDDWDVLLPAVMMAYRSNVHESMHWRWRTIRSVDTWFRRSGARRDCMTGELSDGCLPWEIGYCVIIPQQRNANLTLHGWVHI